jgi:hypothetical protein
MGVDVIGMNHSTMMGDALARAELTAWCRKVKRCPRTNDALIPWRSVLLTVRWPGPNERAWQTIVSHAAFEAMRERLCQQVIATALILEVLEGRALKWPETWEFVNHR